MKVVFERETICINKLRPFHIIIGKLQQNRNQKYQWLCLTDSYSCWGCDHDSIRDAVIDMMNSKNNAEVRAFSFIKDLTKWIEESF